MAIRPFAAGLLDIERMQSRCRWARLKKFYSGNFMDFGSLQETATKTTTASIR